MGPYYTWYDQYMGATQCVLLSILSYLRFVCILNRNEPEEIVVECDWYEKVGDNTFSMSLCTTNKVIDTSNISYIS